MEYLIVIGMIFIFSSLLTILFKKRIEQVIPISIVGLSLIIYLAGMFDNLKIGVIIVGLLAVLGIGATIFLFIKQKDKAKENLKRILTPGAVVYILLSIFFIFINKGRICQDYDEFNHWARIVKNMFVYNTYGVNEESLVGFNEYPPFTAIFQYLFLSIKNVYSEDVIITAQCILYLSIIIPITKNIEWKKNLKNLILLIPSFIFLPVIFYDNFYLDILVDGILGIMFASAVYTAYTEKDIKFKYTKIFAFLIMLALTKTSGVGLATLALIIIAIKLIKDRKGNVNLKKEIRNLVIVILLVTIFTVIWNIKTNNAIKRWEQDEIKANMQDVIMNQRKEIALGFIKLLAIRQDITYKEFTVLISFLILVCTNFIVSKKAKEQNDKEYRYYSLAMLISIPIYMIFVMYTYAFLFSYEEAMFFTSFDRYCSTILLANAMFQLLSVFRFDIKVNFKKVIALFTITLALVNYSNIYEKYVRKKNEITISNINRNVYTRFNEYAERIEKGSKILYIGGSKANIPMMKSINEYASNIKITKAISGNFKSIEDLEETVKNYDYVFVYRMDSKVEEIVSEVFENNEVKNDTLYKVIQNDGNIILGKMLKRSR